VATSFSIAIVDGPPDVVPGIVHHPHVVIDPDVLDGSPYIRGSRVPVRRIWDWHRKGVTVETLVRRYSRLSWANVLDALSFAYDNTELVEQDLARERALLKGEPVDVRFTRKVHFGWASKVRHEGGVYVNQAKAHYLDWDGQPACAKLTHVSRKRGEETRRAPFKCTWGPHVEDRDHLCGQCKKLRDPEKACRCGKCSVTPQPPRNGP
jgi:uncharacterized protein (DUF433 family)